MKNYSILIIDDDKDLLKSLKAILEGDNYKVSTANDAKTGLNMFNEHKPDLLLLDVMMDSDLEGQRLAHSLKSDSENRDLPILIITGMTDTLGVNIRDAFEDIEHLPNVHMLDKPFNSDELLTAVRQLTEGSVIE
jgi:DNA-binding response OmpR family regulator